jgi:hypothetical protein
MVLNFFFYQVPPLQGQFVNSLLRLCVLSLLNRNARHENEVLHNARAGHSLDLAVYLAHHHQPSAQVRFELAIIRCLNGIADQAREIADSIILWLEEDGQENVATVSGGHKPVHRIARLASSVCQVTVSLMDKPCKVLAASGTVPPRESLLLKPSEDGSVPLRGFAEVAHAEDFAQALLMGLQQRVCELLVKNQQLRMALMAERADSHHDHLC